MKGKDFVRKEAIQAALEAYKQGQLANAEETSNWFIGRINADRTKITDPQGREYTLHYTGSPREHELACRISDTVAVVNAAEIQRYTADAGSKVLMHVQSLPTGQTTFDFFERNLILDINTGKFYKVPVSLLPFSSILGGNKATILSYVNSGDSRYGTGIVNDFVIFSPSGRHLLFGYYVLTNNTTLAENGSDIVEINWGLLKNIQLSNETVIDEYNNEYYTLAYRELVTGTWTKTLAELLNGAVFNNVGLYYFGTLNIPPFYFFITEQGAEPVPYIVGSITADCFSGDSVNFTYQRSILIDTDPGAGVSFACAPEGIIHTVSLPVGNGIGRQNVYYWSLIEDQEVNNLALTTYSYSLSKTDTVLHNYYNSVGSLIAGDATSPPPDTNPPDTTVAFDCSWNVPTADSSYIYSLIQAGYSSAPIGSSGQLSLTPFISSVGAMPQYDKSTDIVKFLVYEASLTTYTESSPTTQTSRRMLKVYDNAFNLIEDFRDVIWWGDSSSNSMTKNRFMDTFTGTFLLRDLAELNVNALAVYPKSKNEVILINALEGGTFPIKKLKITKNEGTLPDISYINTVDDAYTFKVSNVKTSPVFNIVTNTAESGFTYVAQPTVLFDIPNTTARGLFTLRAGFTNRFQNQFGISVR